MECGWKLLSNIVEKSLENEQVCRFDLIVELIPNEFQHYWFSLVSQISISWFCFRIVAYYLEEYGLLDEAIALYKKVMEVTNSRNKKTDHADQMWRTAIPQVVG